MNVENITAWIMNANDNDVDKIILAILARQKNRYPDWEGLYLSFPLKDPAACRQIMQSAWEVLSKTIEEEVQRIF